MEVGSSTEMGAPVPRIYETGDRGPKTDRSRPRSVRANGLPSRDLPRLVEERPIANARFDGWPSGNAVRPVLAN
jgi:hypothetical protein